ncbi:MAG: nucleotide sugar dehydrogenase [Trueperaceae bacterium]|nr:nucleotide sugar dehydrogenase [Trueperaceae bacterium]
MKKGRSMPDAPRVSLAIIGLGYVGLPIAVAFARAGFDVIGFDIDASKVDELRGGVDRSGEVESDVLESAALRVTSSTADIRGRDVYVVTVPTPIDGHHRPDLAAVAAASATVGEVMGANSLVVFESTVYPGATLEECVPILERRSGLTHLEDFHVAYSPERINPGDKVHTLETITKVVSGDDDATLERVAQLYESVVAAGVHRAPSIEVAEAAKVIENTQRDLNIALVNELAIIFERLGIRTQDVLEAAGTKWNFLPFRPGLVGGHCIGVDPYYLTSRAEQAGYHPDVILAGRRINEGMGAFVAQRLVKMLARHRTPVGGARIGILGLTFKENVRDLRNSRVPDIVRELQTYDADVLVHDPLVDAGEANREYGIEVASAEQFAHLDAVVVAVPHLAFLEQGTDWVRSLLHEEGIVIDVKSAFDPAAFGPGVTYWSL